MKGGSLQAANVDKHRYREGEITRAQQLDSQDQGFCVNVQNSCKTTESTGNFIAWDLNLF